MTTPDDGFPNLPDPPSQSGYGAGDPMAADLARARQVGAALAQARLVGIAGWAVLGLFALAAVLIGARDSGSFDADLDERLIMMLPVLGNGIFYCGILQGVALWMGKNAA